uniref:pleckstrin homology domain-containing family S member 1-like n=1 Tax=Myxine glutinosa TaxID=7769 RepID=UPI0035901F4D
MADGNLYLQGFFYKSPPPTKINFRLKKSWKRRFVVLQYSTGRPQLSYYEDDKKLTPLGCIAMTSVHEVCKNPKHHGKWETVQRLWGPVAPNTILLKAADRDYFLVADKGVDAEQWFQSLKNALPLQSLMSTDSGV